LDPRSEEKMELMENHRREVEELITARCWGDSLWYPKEDVGYPLVNQHIYGKSPFLMGKST
jgi:hypothetical protein